MRSTPDTTHSRSTRLIPVVLLLAAALSGCVPWVRQSAEGEPLTRRVDALLPADVLLIGEQHDAPEHQQLERETVEALAQQGKLAALAIEMAEQGNDTGYLDVAASETKVQSALNWDDKGWPWKAYGPVVMAAVRAGVTVYGANLPRERMKDAMADVSLDAQLDASALQAQQQAVREGHCDMLPEKQIQPMTRVQMARDRAMAQTIMKARVAGKTVVLVSGAGHNVKTLGVPRYLPTDVRVRAVQLAAGDRHSPQGTAYDAVWLTPPMPERDYCADFKSTRR